MSTLFPSFPSPSSFLPLPYTLSLATSSLSFPLPPTLIPLLTHAHSNTPVPLVNGVGDDAVVSWGDLDEGKWTSYQLVVVLEHVVPWPHLH